MRKLFFESSLEFEINVIGYKNQGECILFFIKTDNNIVYSGMIDCYKEKHLDIIREQINNRHINSLDFVCWTHPHDDHTKGLEGIIREFCGSTTALWVTDIMPNDYALYSDESTRVYKKIKQIHLEDNPEKIKVKYAKNTTIMEKLICSGINEYVFKITSFAPDSTILAERHINDEDEQGNIYSIGLVINFGRYYILLAGDVENLTFREISDFELDHPIDYIKIPHHGSSTASELVKKLSNMDILAPSVATTTVYSRGKIPSKEVLDTYRTWGTETVICTSNIEKEKDNPDLFGMIKTTFDILEQREYQIETTLIGNSVVIK